MQYEQWQKWLLKHYIYNPPKIIHRYPQSYMAQYLDTVTRPIVVGLK